MMLTTSYLVYLLPSLPIPSVLCVADIFCCIVQVCWWWPVKTKDRCTPANKIASPQTATQKPCQKIMTTNKLKFNRGKTGVN